MCQDLQIYTKIHKYKSRFIYIYHDSYRWVKIHKNVLRLYIYKPRRNVSIKFILLF